MEKNVQLNLYIQELLKNPKILKNNIISKNKSILGHINIILSKDNSRSIKHPLQLRFKEYWKECIETKFSKNNDISGNKLRYYQCFKKEFKFEEYLNHFKSFKALEKSIMSIQNK